MAFVLPDLPYAFDALEPIIDAKTMEIHHGRHHATYVANLNKAVENYPEWAEKSIEDVIIHLDEVPEGQTRDDLALIIKEVLLFVHIAVFVSVVYGNYFIKWYAKRLI